MHDAVSSVRRTRLRYDVFACVFTMRRTVNESALRVLPQYLSAVKKKELNSSFFNKHTGLI
jgi:hypothetical protein